jgi:hypothetical protein
MTVRDDESRGESGCRIRQLRSEMIGQLDSLVSAPPCILCRRTLQHTPSTVGWISAGQYETGWTERLFVICLFPDAAIVPQPHRMPSPVPSVERPDHRHPARVRRPDSEADTRGAFAGHRLRAKARGDPTMPPFGEQVDIELPEQRRKGVRVLRLLDHAVPVDAEPVVRPLADFRVEQPRRVHAPEGGQRLPRPPAPSLPAPGAGAPGSPTPRLRGAARAARTDRRASPTPAHRSQPRSSAARHASTVSRRRVSSRLASIVRPRNGMPIQAGRLPAS